MTPPINEDLERLIVRSLDAEASAAEELELNKAVLRSPEARHLMDAYRRNDALASEAMRAALGRGGTIRQAPPRPSPVTTTPRWPPLMALAAAVLLAVGLALSVVFVRSPGDADTETEQPLRPVGRYRLPTDTPTRRDPALIQASAPYQPEVPHQRTRKIDRDYIIIRDDHQADRYYLLERNRTRSVIVPAGGDL